jgi:hypothetical protein
MKYYIALLFTIISLTTLSGENILNNIPGKNIYLYQLEEMFSNIEEKTDWNTSGDMLWGYFFTHREPEKLEKAKDALMDMGYQFVSIYLSRKDNPSDPDKYWLHVAKVEAHSPKSLDKTNDQLFIFAHEFGIDSYDGMDMGPVSK